MLGTAAVALSGRQAVTPDVQLLSTNTRAVHRLRTASLCAGQVPEQSIGGPRSRTDTCVLTHVYLHIAIHAPPRTPRGARTTGRRICGPIQATVAYTRGYRAGSRRTTTALLLAASRAASPWARLGLLVRGGFDAGSFDPDLGELPRLDDVAVLWRCGGCR